MKNAEYISELKDDMSTLKKTNLKLQSNQQDVRKQSMLEREIQDLR
jgi:hypothetical protein